MISPDNSVNTQLPKPARKRASDSPRSQGGASRESESSEPQEARSNPLIFVFQALRGRVLITAILAAVLGCIGALGGFFTQKRSYVSTGIVQVSANKQGILYENQDDSRLRLFDAFVSAEASYLKSRPVLDRTLTQPSIEQMGWTPSSDNFKRLRDSISIDSKGGLIMVSCKYSDAEGAAILVNSILDAYEDLHVELARREDSVRERQLGQREIELLTKLQNLENQMRESGQEYGLQSIASAHVRKIAQIQEVDQRVSELATTVASRESADSLSEVDTGDAEIKRLVVLDHALADMLFERTLRAAKLASAPGLGTSHPLIQNAKLALKSIDSAIEDRRSQLATLGTTGALTKSGKSAEDESLLGLKALLDRLKSRVDDLRGEAKELNSRFIQLEFLANEREQTRLLLDETRNALEQVRVESQNTLPGTIEIRARGSVPTQPDSDKRKIVAAAGAAGGGGTGILGVLALGYLFRRLRFSDEVISVVPSIPLAGVLPDVNTARPEQDVQFKNSIHRLRNFLQLSIGNQNHAQVTVVTSTGEGSGASTVALALARSYADSRLRTVVVDADLVAGTLSSNLGLSARDGVREAIVHDRLSGEVRPTEDHHLFAVPCGRTSDLNDEQVSRPSFSILLERLCSSFDNVVIDVGASNDRLVAEIAAALADQVVVVIPANEPAASAKRVEALLASNSPDLYFVFNRANAKDSAFANRSSKPLASR